MTSRAILDALAAHAPPGTTFHLLETETLGLGVPYVPRAVARALVAADRRLGCDVGRGLVRFVRQVYRYLHHDIGERIRDEVRAELHKPGSRVVDAHSLGSVIAFDVLTRDGIGHGPEGLTTLVTCGPPPAWPTPPLSWVRRRPSPSSGWNQLAEPLRSW
ncbi:hypothetical protein [Streptomyces sp. Ncost-T10-10d]|uniref:hypothetical protein n=1 Tax=Streptomyces sp. Ncost-T10-10d TaxID=1839774 RepID=UPI00081DEC7A|nr:hypothetical protein [Streptomyces sp. Ncost-T10-10d]SCF73279.1 hypothetical protein GA0115254_114423 [Streptomyces sp. Ncost-T10-10d]